MIRAVQCFQTAPESAGYTLQGQNGSQQEILLTLDLHLSPAKQGLEYLNQTV